MSDPPLPLSPYAPSPASPSPKAANPRTFWRDIIRRVSRSNPNLNPTNLHHPSEPPSTPQNETKLVEINLPHPQQQHDTRRQTHHPVNPSAFDDLPPAQVYDPAWNTNPLRCEAGRLGSNTSGPNTPLLPGAFTIKSSDLEDEEDDESLGYHTQRSTIPTPTTSSPPSNLHPLPQIPHPPETLDSPEIKRSTRPRRSFVLWNNNTVDPVMKTNPALTKPTLFHSTHSISVTTQHLTTVLERHIKGDILSIKPGEIRARVPIPTKDNKHVTLVVVISSDDRQSSCRVSVRRSFADTFRISIDEFDTFCSELQKRFHELDQLTTR